MEKINIPWTEAASLEWHKSGSSYAVTVNLEIYSLESVLKTCYLFLDQCFLFAEAEGGNHENVKVYFTPQNESDDIEQLIGEFSNRLLWQEVRQRVADETAPVRELIVAQALTEASVTGKDFTQADYNRDPLGIGE